MLVDGGLGHHPGDGPNAWSPWYSMGGKTKCCSLLSGVPAYEKTWTPIIIMNGTDGRPWYRQRYANGSGWTPWRCCYYG